MERYRLRPSAELAKDIARHMVLVEVAEQLREWAEEGVDDESPQAQKGRGGIE